MKTMFVYYFGRWPGPIMSNDKTNELMYHIIDSLGFRSDGALLKWYWSIADFDSLD